MNDRAHKKIGFAIFGRAPLSRERELLRFAYDLTGIEVIRFQVRRLLLPPLR